jgi:hypothetical protein
VLGEFDVAGHVRLDADVGDVPPQDRIAAGLELPIEDRPLDLLARCRHADEALAEPANPRQASRAPAAG